MGAEDLLRLGEPFAEEDLWHVARDLVPELERLLAAKVLVWLIAQLLEEAGCQPGRMWYLSNSFGRHRPSSS